MAMTERPAPQSARTRRGGAGRRLRNRLLRARERLLRAHADVALVGAALAWHRARAASADASATDAHDAGGGHGDERALGASEAHDEGGHAHAPEVLAVLFPWFAELVGVVAYYLLSRHAHAVPYTAVMFVVGALIGVSVHHAGSGDLLSSAATWIGINGEVILLVFLPGLLYLDSYNIDVHLFAASFFQLLLFAFPMVLAGTTLTALVAKFVLPYDWSFDLCMTFGSILAATDPVAVAVLLNELGAPPRLKMHVSGESLLNDGSAVVFYNIFNKRFLYELGIAGVGEDVDWGEGFVRFFRLSLGGTCIGIAFGVGLLIILYSLNRRLSGEDCVVQVVATITAAYLVFFTSEILAECSGIIAVVFCGVTVKAFGETFYNDAHLSHHFWEITEYLLNTLLFTLGGCVWGDIISKTSGEDAMLYFRAEDWGYLFLLFFLVIIIRFFLVFTFYPITSKIGIGSSWREAVFMSYGGLRGAVGIALALSLHAEVYQLDTDVQFQGDTAKLFGMVGGIALLTLVVCAPTCGPLLKKLGLVTPTETRKKVLENYHQHEVYFVLLEYIKLLTEQRFSKVDFTVIKAHTCLKEITYEQLVAAVKKHKDKSPAAAYIKPNLTNVLPYLYGQPGGGGTGGDQLLPQPMRFSDENRRTRRSSVQIIRTSRGNRGTVFDLGTRVDESTAKEERLIFIKILRSAYHRQIDHGEVEPRGFIVHSLFRSLEYAQDAVSSGLPLDDWNALQVASNTFTRPAEITMFKFFEMTRRIRHKKINAGFDLDFFLVQQRVRQILAFIHAHEWARKIFKEEFSKVGEDSLTASEKIVLDESDKQVEMADLSLSDMSKDDVKTVTSRYACHILLNRAAYKWKDLKKHGLVTEREAGEKLEEIEEEIYHVLNSSKLSLEEELSPATKMKRLTTIPSDLKAFVADQKSEPMEEIEEEEHGKEEGEKMEQGIEIGVEVSGSGDSEVIVPSEAEVNAGAMEISP